MYSSKVYRREEQRNPWAKRLVETKYVGSKRCLGRETFFLKASEERGKSIARKEEVGLGVRRAKEREATGLKATGVKERIRGKGKILGPKYSTEKEIHMLHHLLRLLPSSAKYPSDRVLTRG